MIKIEDIYKFVLDNNPPLDEVIPKYKITINYYDRTEEIVTEDLTILSNIPCPSAETELLNQQEYDEYFKKLIEFKNRSEYIWYLILKEMWRDVDDKTFEEIYKNTWDTYHSIGGWDMVGEKMEEYYDDTNLTPI
jgi:hypothetical protein